MITANPDAGELLSLVLSTDFEALVKRRVSLIKFLSQVVREPAPIDPPPLQGALDTTAIGTFFDEKIKGWPPLFWTVALTHQRKVMFTRDGIFVEQAYGNMVQDTVSLSLGTAIRATCAVPFLIDPVAFTSGSGEKHLLIDGGLGPEGRCPASVPQSLFPMENSFLILVDLGEDRSHLHRLLDRAFGTAAPESIVEEPGPLPHATNHTRIVIAPSVPISGSFKFRMTRREKWQIIMSGYMAAVDACETHSMLSDCALTSARERGMRALLLLAQRRRPYLRDVLPPELDKVFADLKFGEEKLTAPVAGARP